MRYVSWLERVGTISLDIEFMERTIAFGKVVVGNNNELIIDESLAPNTLEITVWLEFVPEPFREKAKLAMVKIVSESFLNRIDPNMVTSFIQEFQSYAESEYMMGNLTRDGWK